VLRAGELGLSAAAIVTELSDIQEIVSFAGLTSPL